MIPINFADIVNHSPLNMQQVVQISKQVQGFSTPEAQLVVTMSCQHWREDKIVAEILRRRKSSHRA